MNYNFNNETPIYLQIVDLVIKDICNGNLKSGEKILSVREFALLYKVNPNTICKALNVLEEEQLIYTERTNGKYITNDINLIQSYRDKIFQKKINDFLYDLKIMGYTEKEIINKIMESKNESGRI